MSSLNNSKIFCFQFPIFNADFISARINLDINHEYRDNE